MGQRAAVNQGRSLKFNRRFPRRLFRRGVGVLLGGKYFLAHGSEIGEGGLSFQSEVPLRVGALVVLNFQIPDGEFVSVRAEVRNTEESTESNLVYGCAFDNLPFDRKREIRTFVTNRTNTG